MVEFYSLLTFPRFPLRKKVHKSYFGKNRTHDFRNSRCAGYLLDHSGDERRAIKFSIHSPEAQFITAGLGNGEVSASCIMRRLEVAPETCVRLWSWVVHSGTQDSTWCAPPHRQLVVGRGKCFHLRKYLTLVRDLQQPNPAVRFVLCMFWHTRYHFPRDPNILRRKDAYYAAVALATMRIGFSVAVTQKRRRCLGLSERSRFRNADRLVDYSDQ